MSEEKQTKPNRDRESYSGLSFRDLRQTPVRNEVSDVVAPSRWSDTTIRCRSMRPNSRVAMKPGRQRSKINKVPFVVDNRQMNRIGRGTRANGAGKRPFSIIRDQFSSLPVEDRLLFLSWLFEGALSQCHHTSSSAGGTMTEGSILEEKKTSTSPAESFTAANIVDIEHPVLSRKGLRFSEEEERLLVKLRKEEGLAWWEVIKRFSRSFPGSSEGSIQVHWSKTLS